MRPSSPLKTWLRAQTRLGQRAAAPVIALSLCGTLAGIGQALIAGWALAALIHGKAPGLLPLAGFACLAVLRAGLGYAAERAAFEAGAAARRRLRSETLARLLAIGPALLHVRHSAELAATVVDRIDALEGFFARYVPAAVLAMAAPCLILLAALLVDPGAALILALAGLLVPLAMALSGIGAAAASRRQLQALERLQVRFLDRVRGIATIVMAGRVDAEAAALGRAADELRRRTMRVLRVAFLSSVALDLAAAVAIVLIALRGAGVLFGAHSREAARTLSVLLLTAEFFVPLRAFAAAYQDRSQAAGAAEEIASLPPAPVLSVPAQPVRTVQARGVTVAFEDVTFHWDPARPAALDRVSFRLAAGETLVLVGPSGSGKSTLLEILLGFVRPDSGRVTLNGADIASVVPEALSRLVGWIGQTPVLFAGTIEDNVRFARPEASAADVAEAIRAARLDRLVAELPRGLATPIGEGGYGLSGGQAQRVAVARAFLRNAPLLLLDEPTAHLDPAVESELLESLRRLALGRTVILASHSAAAHAFAGRRLDLLDGRVVGPAMARGAA
jgi:ATP-binding cassette subfamily C protein CydD